MPAGKRRTGPGRSRIAPGAYVFLNLDKTAEGKYGDVVMPSIKDVSIRAGVSPSTVSRVITGAVPVDAETRRRVESAIDELGYRPNLFARGLRNRSARLIGLMVPEVMHETFSAFIEYTEDACRRHGFTLLLGNTKEDPDIEKKVLETFAGMSVDGVIVSQVSDASAIIRDMRERGIPVVGIDRALETEKVDRVVADNRGAGLLAARYLRSMGHREVLCLGGPTSIKLSRDRWEGFKTYYAQQGCEVPYIEGSDFGFEAGVQGIRQAFRKGFSFTALWAQSDLIAIGAMKELVRLGTQVPRDVSVLGMDDIRLAEMLTPELTSIRQPLRAMCEHAVDLIVHRLGDPEREAETITLETELIIRSSVVRRS